ncbi:mitochondrial fission ELM1 family protein [Maricaulis parjimensis]|uniref:mitochondrial fission ELM1 family protein n=1 Tax=Maricaulis parjimensis TaxID=144023 RepID=UPI00193A4DB3|nr:mitochondrial fission ELM1 family protein [Maricaulis parjimensis]
MSTPNAEPHTPTIWVVSDGRRGIENQALGLAEAVSDALGGVFQIERVVVHKGGLVALPAASHPDIWIGCGRAAIPLARKHRRIFPDTFFVYVQDPRGHYGEFDLIIAPDHDRLKRPNAISMIGSPNRISRAKLDEGRAEFAAQIDALPAPRAAVLIGGASKRFKVTPQIADYLEQRLDDLLALDVSLMLTVSRRTPDAIRDRLAERFADRERVWFFDGDGPNPYFAFLAAADWIFVTEESTNMLLEAGATGAPVYVLPMAGDPGKFARLHAALEGRDITRPYLGRLDRWTYAPLAETGRMAQALIRRWRADQPAVAKRIEETA